MRRKIIRLYDRFKSKTAIFGPVFQGLKSYNEKLTIIEESKLSVINRAMPTYMTIGNTHKCNLACIMCVRQKEAGSNMDAPSMEEGLFGKIAHECFPYLKRVALSVSGEPLLDEKLEKILDMANQYKVKVDATTNGTVTMKDSLMKKLAENMGSFVVSFDAFKKETYESIKKGANYEKTIENIKRFNYFRKKLPKSERPTLGFSYVMMRRNIEELPDFIKLAKELEANSVSAAQVVVFFQELKDESLIFHKELANECMKMAKMKARKLGVPLNLPPSYGNKQKEKKKNKEKIRCPFLWKQSWIEHNGNVVPCCSPKDSRPTMGNVKENSFREIWNGKVYQEMRRGMKEGKPFECCRNCYIIEQELNPGNEDAFILI